MADRSLTDADRAAAKVFSEAVARSGLTYEEIAAAVGVTPGMVHQWIKPLRPVSARRAVALARILGVDDPSKISVAYASALSPGAGGPALYKHYQQTKAEGRDWIRGGSVSAAKDQGSPPSDVAPVPLSRQAQNLVAAITLVDQSKAVSAATWRHLTGLVNEIGRHLPNSTLPVTPQAEPAQAATTEAPVQPDAAEPYDDDPHDLDSLSLG